MFPGPAVSTKPEMNLSRLAEIAEAVSKHQGPSGNSVEAAPPKTFNPFQAVSVALRKRPGTHPALGVMRPAKQARHSQEGSAPSCASSVTNSVVEEEHLEEEGEEPLTGGATEVDDPKGVRFREYQAEIWSEKFEDLCAFRKQVGHCHVPHTFPQNPPLAQWVKRQRYQYKLKAEGKRSTLSDERVRLLNKIGFIWNSHDVVWEERWNELLAFKRIHGHCIVPSNYEKNPQLAVWVKRQRRQFKFYQEKKATSMTPERITKLDKLGFAWDCRKVPNMPRTNSPVPQRQKQVAPQTLPTLPMASRPRNDNPKAVDMAELLKRQSSKLGGFPLAATRPVPTCKTTPVADSSPKPVKVTVPPKETTVTSTPNKTTDVSKLPCEFFSFSRKFTKFPKIKIPKY